MRENPPWFFKRARLGNSPLLSMGSTSLGSNPSRPMTMTFFIFCVFFFWMFAVCRTNQMLNFLFRSGPQPAREKGRHSAYQTDEALPENEQHPEDGTDDRHQRQNLI